MRYSSLPELKHDIIIVLGRKLRGAEMKCLSINIDQGVPMQTLPEKIYLKEEEVIKMPLFKEAKKNWDKIELPYYTAYYGKTLYKKSPFDVVMYVDHEKRLDLEYEYMDKVRREKVRINKRLSNLRSRIYSNLETLQEKIEAVIEELKYHRLEYKIFEVTGEGSLIKKGKLKNRKRYAFRYQFQEKKEPDFFRYEMCLLRGWGRDIGTLLRAYGKMTPETNLPSFIEESVQ